MNDQQSSVPAQVNPTVPSSQVDLSVSGVVPMVQQNTPSVPQDDRNIAAINAMVSQAANQDDTLNPPVIGSSSREKAPLVIEHAGEMPAGMQSVEQLRSPEISPAVEKFIEEVEEDPTQFTKEVVLADQNAVFPTQGFIAQPVIILPMTEQEFEEGKKMPPTESKRWLAEWTEKIKKIFAGNVIFGGS